jgi:BlaI family transcriptional regulator, penicillinase repressor
MSPTKRNSGLHLPPLELECLQALWALGQGTVQQLHAHLLASRPLAYTTVLTVMDRLTRKGMVEREKRGRAHLYHSRVAEEELRQGALHRLLRDFFGGSREELLRYLEPTMSGARRSGPAVQAGARAPSSPAAEGAAMPAGVREIDTELL